MQEEQKEKPRPRHRARWLTLLLALFGGPFLAEGGLRFLIFSDTSLARSLGAGLRREGLYAHPFEHDDYWKLRRVLRAAPEERFRGPPRFDPHLGWIAPWIEPGEYRHVRADQLAGRRPVLLYGASCAVPGYEELMERSELADRYRLLCYGVGGYGVDQVYMLLQKTLDHFDGQDPVVVFGLVEGTDFDRCVLSIRSWPKPRFRLDEDGALALEEALVLPVEEYFERHPLEIDSYIWSHLIHTDSWMPREWRSRFSDSHRRMNDKRALITAIVKGMKAEVDARGLETFCILFHAEADLRPGRQLTWKERFLRGLLARQGIPYLLAGDLLRAESARTGEPLDVYFQRPGDPMPNHPSKRGREVLFEHLRRGLAGDFDG